MSEFPPESRMRGGSSLRCRNTKKRRYVCGQEHGLAWKELRGDSGTEEDYYKRSRKPMERPPEYTELKKL